MADERCKYCHRTTEEGHSYPCVVDALADPIINEALAEVEIPDDLPDAEHLYRHLTVAVAAGRIVMQERDAALRGGDEFRRQRDEERARVEELEDALRPFAEHFGGRRHPGSEMVVSRTSSEHHSTLRNYHFNAARSAMEKTK